MILRLLCIALVVTPLFSIPLAHAQSTKEYTVPLVLGFDGESMLGKNAASTLYLQLWSTMRRAHNGRDFGPSVTKWGDYPVQPYSHAEAANRAANRGAHAVLWGRAHKYGGGLLIEPRITIPRYGGRASENEAWSVEFDGKTFRVRFPNRQIDWANTVLLPETVAELRNPFGVPIFRTRNSNEVKGYMTGFARALRWGSGYAEIEDVNDNGEWYKGWIRFSQIGQNDRPAAVYAMAGIIRMIRSDYGGAIDFFNRILDSPGDASERNLLDVRLLRGVSFELSGRSGLKDFKFVYDQDPFSISSIEHYAGGLISKYHDASSENKRQMVKDLLDRSGFYLDKESDLWSFK